jgi:lipopolysaccharide biosynthesis glycosyltransferase
MNTGEITMPGGKDTVQVVMALHDKTGKYSRHAGVAVTSIFEKTSSPVCITILHDETLTDDNRSRFERTAEKFHQDVRFLDVSEAVIKMGDDIDALSGSYTRGSLFRLLIPDVIAVSKVIYLDCDVAVNLDIAELWSLGSNDFAVTVVMDDTIWCNRKWHRRIRAWALGYDGQECFCSGVMFMNLDRIREKYNMVREAHAFFTRYTLGADYPDQDFLNVLFRGDACYIDKRFHRLTDYSDVENSILHLVDKPWIDPTGAPPDYIYWEIFARSEWRDQIADAVVGMNKNHPYRHRHTSDCWKRLLNNLKKELTVNNFFFRLWKCARIIARETRFRRAAKRRR